jgi:hypothetical protein
MNPFAKLLLLAASLSCAAACSSAPTDPNAKTEGGPPPAWTQQPARTAENGYIIYVGNGEDSTVERAHFKASGMAIQDLVNECSLAPKGTRTEDSYEQKPEGGHMYKAWVKVSIQYEDCEDAKKATDPEAIRKLANVQLTEELKRYQQMIDEPAPEVLAGGDNAGVNPALGNTGGTYSGGGGGGVRVVAINDYNGFFWARQQVAYTKEVVVLAPPNQYQPGTPQTAQFVHQVAPAQAAVTGYEAQNPETKTWHQAYSASPVRQQMIQQRAATRAAAAPPQHFNNRAQGGGGHGQNGKNGGRKRKRRNW